MVLQKDGSVWTTGLNENGQLGDGTTTERHGFVKAKCPGCVTTVDTDGDLRLVAYWDLGTCGPGAEDDQNWEWCGKQAFKCVERVTVSKAICASGAATLKETRGGKTLQPGNESPSYKT